MIVSYCLLLALSSSSVFFRVHYIRGFTNSKKVFDFDCDIHRQSNAGEFLSDRDVLSSNVFSWVHCAMGFKILQDCAIPLNKQFIMHGYKFTTIADFCNS